MLLFEIPNIVRMVKIAVIQIPVRAGTADGDIQKDNHVTMTIMIVGRYTWMIK